MKKILRRLSCLQANDRGFAMPLALGFGLVVILVATALLIRTNDDKATASLQRAADSSLNVTEAGVTKIMTFMNSNRLVATKNWADWSTTLNVNTTASDCNGISNIEDQVAIASTFANWQNVDSADATKGQFKIVNYLYTAAPSATQLGTGILTVDGRLPDQQSIQRVQVTIPVKRDDSNAAIPGLWLAKAAVKNGTSIATDNNTINGNALINDCKVDLSTIKVVSPYVARYTTRSFPPLPTIPNPAPNTLTSNGNGNGNGNGNNSDVNLNADLTLPRSTDKVVTKTLADGTTAQVYEYVVNGNLNIKSKLTIAPGKRVTFYLNGDLNLNNGAGSILHNCTGLTNCSPTDVQIFGYGPDGSKICLNGGDKLYAFILAPNYTAGVKGAGNNGGFYGAVWTKQWSTSGQCGGSNTQNEVINQTANWDLSDLTIETYPARLDPISAWERKEYN